MTRPGTAGAAPRTEIRRVLSALLLTALPVAPAPAGAADPAYESSGRVPSSRYLKPGEMKGANWSVAADAVNDGAYNTYRVESRVGAFDARGRAQLAVRGKEVDALIELERVSKSDVFLAAAKKSALAPVKVVASFADEPVETVKGIGSGAKRLFDKTRFQAGELSHEAKGVVSDEDGKSGSGESTTAKATQAAEAYAKKYLGLSKAERHWYAQLGVDPYTDNEPLRKAVREISRVEAAATFGMRFAGLPGIPGAREVGKVMDLVWKTDPWELRKQNRETLLAAGIDEATARAFEDNAAMSPTQQTALIHSLKELAGVRGRDHLVARAVDVDDTASARALVTSTALLVRYHRQVAPLTEILGGARLPVARARDGRLVAVAVVDAIFWTSEVAEAARGFAALYTGDPARTRELRLVGEASDRFVDETRALGWTVHEQWQTAAPEDQAAAGGCPRRRRPPALLEDAQHLQQQEQDHRPADRDEVDGEALRCDAEARREPPAEHRPDDADHHVRDQPHLGVGLHDQATDPPDESSDDQEHDPVHLLAPFRRRRAPAGPSRSESVSVASSLSPGRRSGQSRIDTPRVGP